MLVEYKIMIYLLETLIKKAYQLFKINFFLNIKIKMKHKVLLI